VGGGVAVPHGAVDEVPQQVGALLVCPIPIPFDAIDGEPVSILFALIGPKGAPAQHLKVLARVSRLLRRDAFRARLAAATDGAQAYALIRDNEPGDP
jgi:PTS system nitrogen regulatory IIA component